MPWAFVSACPRFVLCPCVLRNALSARPNIAPVPHSTREGSGGYESSRSRRKGRKSSKVDDSSSEFLERGGESGLGAKGSKDKSRRDTRYRTSRCPSRWSEEFSIRLLSRLYYFLTYLVFSFSFFFVFFVFLSCHLFSCFSFFYYFFRYFSFFSPFHFGLFLVFLVRCPIRIFFCFNLICRSQSCPFFDFPFSLASGLCYFSPSPYLVFFIIFSMLDEFHVNRMWGYSDGYALRVFNS